MFKMCFQEGVFNNTILETLFNLLKRLDFQKDALNYNRLNFFDIDNLVPKRTILVNVKIIADTIWKW